jgi:2,4-dienoyl-CoA reductase-like NADH-dependent reductase (Old Yellow Enzyme family)
MAHLFEATKLDNIALENRFVRSATWEGLATPDGYPTSMLTQVLVNLARGGVGLIITSHAYVSREGQAGPFQLGIYSDDHVAPLREMTKAVHDAGGKIVAQLAHGGCAAAAQLTGSTPRGPSAIEKGGRRRCDEMTRDDIARLRTGFARAAVRAREAGFDGVQLHAAHGYLMSQFLSPLCNRRQDDYGGSPENRARMLLDVVEAAKSAAGSAFGIMVKINSEDFMEGGFRLDEMLALSAMLEDRGIDAIEMSGGTVRSKDYSPSRMGKTARVEGEAYYIEAARRYKEKIRVPLMLVGGIRSYDVAERLVAEGTADYISLCRPLIAEPDLINRWRSGDREPSACKSDNLCFKPALEGRGVCCVVREKRRSVK